MLHTQSGCVDHHQAVLVCTCATLPWLLYVDLAARFQAVILHVVWRAVPVSTDGLQTDFPVLQLPMMFHVHVCICDQCPWNRLCKTLSLDIPVFCGYGVISTILSPVKCTQKEGYEHGPRDRSESCRKEEKARPAALRRCQKCSIFQFQLISHRMRSPVALLLLTGLLLAPQQLQVPVHAHVFVVVPASRGFSPGMDTLAVAGELKSRYDASAATQQARGSLAAAVLPVSVHVATPLLPTETSQQLTETCRLKTSSCFMCHCTVMQGAPLVRHNS